MSDREIMNAKSSTKKVMMKFRDPVVQRVCEKFTQRSDEGFAKYGRTLSDEMLGGHKDLYGYLNDVQEELMDATIYIERLKKDLKYRELLGLIKDDKPL